MKNRFSTIDIVGILSELQHYVGMRLNRVYDVDTKTYLLKLNREEEKVTLLIESGIRIHTTEFEWPKNPAPSGFSMKLRKHLKNKRLEKIVQLGIDRIIDMQFGSGEVAYHVILELYDRGNIALTDHTYTILNILRPRTIGSEDVKLVVREKYPIENARQRTALNREEIYYALNAAKPFANLKKTLMPCLPYGPAVLDHVLTQSKLPKNCAIGKQFSISSDINHLFLCLEEAEKLLVEAASGQCKGYIIQKVEESSNALGNVIVTNVEFHPFLFAQHKTLTYAEYPSFNTAVDNFFSSLEGQKIDQKALQKEKEAMKKLENVKKDHEKRLQQLQKGQEEDVKKAQLIEMNLDFVDKAILIMRGTIAGQFSWGDINEMVADAKRSGDPVACAIKKLKLEINHITLMLNDPYADGYSDDEDALENSESAMAVDIDLGLSAYANARKYYDQKRYFAKKEQKTIESSEKAYKSAERKTKLALKEVAVITSVTKARKTFWFEKFLWFISSENYLVIAGRDIQQNELIVKRYMKPGDVYVHADIRGASSIVIKNFQGGEIPPKTLNEAGTMAICYSTAWEPKIITSAWWVYHHQVSKTAPSGEYLTPGSFMIRGKKNYLPPSHLILGFGFLFKLDEDSLEHHIGERNISDDVQVDNPELEAHNEGNDLMSDDDDDDDGTSTENNEEQQLKDVDSNDEDTCDKQSNSNNSSMEFPDTEIKFDMLKIDSKKDETDKSEEPVETTMIVQVPRKVKKAPKTKKNVPCEEETVQDVPKKETQGALKRGQKGKLKKIKEKYRDQDEEERELRMKILASAGEPKEDKKKKKNKEAKVLHKPNNKQKNAHFAKLSHEICNDNNTEVKEEVLIPTNNDDISETVVPEQGVSDDVSETVVPEQGVSDDEVEDADHDAHTSDDIKILCSLTGMPISEDTLLFALPVCAPYIAMQNYKYKVKVMPGGGRRGKASKTALQLFLHDKSGTSREKDLLRSVKDQDISRNFPGKVKLSAPNLKKAK